MTREEMKGLAKEQLRGHWGIVIAVVLVASIFTNGVVIDYIGEWLGFSKVTVNAISLFLGGAISVGLCSFLLKFVKENEEPEFTEMFSGFNVYLKTLGLNLLVGIIVILGTLLLVVPGIIASLAFSQAYYIMAEDNSKSISECINESQEMMNGHKWDFFIFQLSFLGWWLLAAITLGIGGLWVGPYQKVAETNYYLYIKNNKR